MADRQRWSSRTIFLFAAIGSAVGLGNIWRFPYLTYKFGGGAFLIPYLLALFILGIPLLMLEFALGQKLQKGAVDAYKNVHSRLGGIGVMALFAGFIVVVYYAVVMAWSLVFFVYSFSSPLPWFNNPEGFFYNSVLGISESVGQLGGINIGLLIALLVVWIVIYFCVRNGVKSVGKVVAITVPLPIILLVLLFFRGITLPGAFTGIGYYLRPDFSALLDSEIWLAAVSQIFFTLSLAFGIMIAYASYNKESQDIKSDAYITALVNSGISLFAGFVVFAVLGHMAIQGGVGIDDVVSSGPGLAFVVFPKALSLLPFAWIFAGLFFLTLLSLGIDSAFSLVEAVNTSIADKYKKPNYRRIAMCVCFVAFLLGITFTTGAGLYLLDIIDHFVTSYALVLVGIFECIAIGWIYGADKMRVFINSVSKVKVGKWWDVSIKYIIPILLVILLVVQFIRDINTPYEGYPGWALGIGWGVVIVPVVVALIASFGSRK
jgi:neurotransmitter:Na+ symporter, NSS family